MTAAKGKTAGAGRKAGSGGTPTKQQQIDGIQAIKDARPAETPAGPPGTPPAPAQREAPSWLTDNRGAPSWWGVPDGVSAANAGGGFVLGLALWVVGVNYLRGGVPQVKQLLRAKFLNQTGA